MLKKIIFIFSIFLFSISFANDRDVTIYDCFTFFNELEILNIRLEELYDEVDHFVIVEFTKSFNGKKKPLYFSENEHRFTKFADKITHIIVDNVGSENIQEKQRNAIYSGIKNAKDTDIIFISDVDEIISSKKLNELIEPIIQSKTNIMRAELRSYKWFLNRWYPTQPFVNSFVVVKKEVLNGKTPHEIKSKGSEKIPYIKDAGWHLTNQGFMKNIIPKFKALNQEIHRRYSKHARFIIEQARECVLSPIGETYPKHVQKNIAYYKKHNFIDDELSKTKTLKLMKRREKENKFISLNFSH